MKHATEVSLFGLLALVLSLSCGAGEKLNRIATESEFSQFMHTYYQHPQPELVSDAIAYVGRSRLLSRSRGAEPPFLAFFSTVFAGNPSMADEWKKVVGEQEPQSKSLFTKALAETPGKIIGETRAGPARNDMYWGCFFASGDEAYLASLIEQLRHLDERKDFELYAAAATAKWSLSSNARTHAKVRTAIEALQASHDRTMRAAASDILAKRPEQIMDEMALVVRQQRANGVWK